MVYVCMHFSAEKGAVEDSTLHHCCLIMVGGHFFKRCAEVLFVHKYSGVMNVLTCILVSLGYASVRCCSITTARSVFFFDRTFRISDVRNFGDDGHLSLAVEWLAERIPSREHSHG